MRSRFEVVTPADEVDLLTPSELRIAAGLDPADSSQDVILQQIADGIYDALARQCKIRTDGVVPPTFLEETLRETWYPEGNCEWNYSIQNLTLSRRPIVSVSTIVEDDVSLVLSTDYIIFKSKGSLTRVSENVPKYWLRSSLIVVTYVAGFDTVPNVLKAAASAAIKDYKDKMGQQLGVKEIEIFDVLRRVYDTDSTSGSGISNSFAISPSIMSTLGSFINYREG